jgi:hypothetical protein
MPADVYVLSKPNVRFSGLVDSVGLGVTPDADVFGRFAPALPECSERSTGCIWHRDTRSASASKILFLSCFE